MVGEQGHWGMPVGIPLEEAVVQEFAANRPRRLLETLGIEIADEVLGHFAVATVDHHLRTVYRKLGVSSRRHLPQAMTEG